LVDCSHHRVLLVPFVTTLLKTKWGSDAVCGATTLPPGLRFLSLQTLPLLFDFPNDMVRLPAEVNRLSNQVLVSTYEHEWGRALP